MARPLTAEQAERLAALMKRVRGGRSFRAMEQLSGGHVGKARISASTWARWEKPEKMQDSTPQVERLVGVVHAGADADELFATVGMEPPPPAAAEDRPTYDADVWPLLSELQQSMIRLGERVAELERRVG